SDNLHAELLLRLLGQYRSPQAPDHGITGLAAVTEFWRSQGITPQQMHLADGSGLSRHNLITPRALVTMLRRIEPDVRFRRTMRSPESRAPSHPAPLLFPAVFKAKPEQLLASAA
ncbi:MAG: hypothetical protein HC919_15630, partial [Oscillatoriales cyanobacterium SM2_2_1]|nr:hypothetical protein [Oscillatoriales cyanobacterium SM2_2_1]